MCAGGADRCAAGHDFVTAGVSAWAGARVVRDVARWPACPAFSAAFTALPHAGFFDVGGGICGRNSGRTAGHRHARRSSNIGTLFAFALVGGGVLILRYREPIGRAAFGARRTDRADHDDSHMPAADGRASHNELDPFLRVACDRPCSFIISTDASTAACDGKVQAARKKGDALISIVASSVRYAFLGALLWRLCFWWLPRLLAGAKTPSDDHQQGGRHAAGGNAPFFQQTADLSFSTSRPASRKRRPPNSAIISSRLDHYGPFPFTGFRAPTPPRSRNSPGVVETYGLLPWQIGIYSPEAYRCLSRARLG